jgi:NADPH-dependent curcumin reductase CurA
MKTNRKILLASRPKGMPTKENFKFIESEIPSIVDGELLIRSLYVSVDPYMRGRMNDAKSYVPPYPLEEVITGGVVGQVVESKNPNFTVGDFVSGELGWQEYNVSDGKRLAKLDPKQAPITTALGVVGMPGLTAYFGLLDIGNPQPGETVVVSGAAGAVGSVAGQIAKMKGCRVVGIAGGEEKVRFLKEELGFDEAIDYKATDQIRKSLKEACPNGVDVYFDNVGGTITDAVMTLINYRARIAICGQIALYNLDKPDVGPRYFTPLLINSALAKGFIVSDYRDRFKEGFNQLAQWVREGKLKYRETIVEGFDQIPDAFLGLFRGENIGKQLVKVAEPESY